MNPFPTNASGFFPSNVHLVVVGGCGTDESVPYERVGVFSIQCSPGGCRGAAERMNPFPTNALKVLPFNVHPAGIEGCGTDKSVPYEHGVGFPFDKPHCNAQSDKYFFCCVISISTFDNMLLGFLLLPVENRQNSQKYNNIASVDIIRLTKEGICDIIEPKCRYKTILEVVYGKRRIALALCGHSAFGGMGGTGLFGGSCPSPGSAGHGKLPEQGEKVSERNLAQTNMEPIGKTKKKPKTKIEEKPKRNLE